MLDQRVKQVWDKTKQDLVQNTAQLKLADQQATRVMESGMLMGAMIGRDYEKQQEV